MNNITVSTIPRNNDSSDKVSRSVPTLSTTQQSWALEGFAIFCLIKNGYFISSAHFYTRAESRMFYGHFGLEVEVVWPGFFLL